VQLAHLYFECVIDRVTLEVQKYLDLLIDEEESPVSPQELAQVNVRTT